MSSDTKHLKFSTQSVKKAERDEKCNNIHIIEFQKDGEMAQDEYLKE
jgi:hypothetical protein